MLLFHFVSESGVSHAPSSIVAAKEKKKRSQTRFDIDMFSDDVLVRRNGRGTAISSCTFRTPKVIFVSGLVILGEVA